MSSFTDILSPRLKYKHEEKTPESLPKRMVAQLPGPSVPEIAIFILLLLGPSI